MSLILIDFLLKTTIKIGNHFRKPEKKQNSHDNNLPRKLIDLLIAKSQNCLLFVSLNIHSLLFKDPRSPISRLDYLEIVVETIFLAATLAAYLSIFKDEIRTQQKRKKVKLLSLFIQQIHQLIYVFFAVFLGQLFSNQLQTILVFLIFSSWVATFSYLQFGVHYSITWRTILREDDFVVQLFAQATLLALAVYQLSGLLPTFQEIQIMLFINQVGILVLIFAFYIIKFLVHKNDKKKIKETIKIHKN